MYQRIMSYPQSMAKDISKIEYLRDAPVEDSSGDGLEHKSISETLGDIIAKWKPDEGSFTIGLFGSWGTGKSGIGRVLRSQYIDKKTTKLVEFDIWKYESDSFRRQFLLFLNEKDGFDTGIDELKKIYESGSRVEQTPNLQSDKNSIVRLAVPFVIAGAGVLLLLTSDYTNGNIGLKVVMQAVGGLGTLAGIQLILVGEIFKKLLDWLFASMKGLLKVQEITITEHRIEFAEQFERLFDLIISQTLEQGYEKVVIIIDNLDRVSDERILELLSAVKTFLERKRVAFLIQCDENAIKRHLLHIYHKDSNNKESEKLGERYTDEFLRKFFNTYVRIPPVLGGDLDRYTRKLVEETKIPINDEQTLNDLLAVISASHRDNPNPRKIKQFINALVSTYILACHRESPSHAVLRPEGVVSDNIQMLAKVMVIAQRYSSFCEDLQQEPGLWNITDRLIVENEEPEDERLKKHLEDRKDDSLYRFLVRTKFITTNNISPFIYLKQSEDSQKISTNAEKLTEALQDADEDKVSELLGKVEHESTKDLERFVLEKIDEVKSSSIRVFNIINSFFGNEKVKQLPLSNSFYNQIASHITGSSSGHKHFIEGFSVLVLFDLILPNINATNRGYITTEYVNLFGRISRGDQLKVNVDSDKVINEFISQVAQHPEFFSQPQQKEISSILESSPLINDVDKVAPLLVSEQSRDAFITANHLERIIATIAPGDLSVLDEKNSVLLKKVRLVIGAEGKATKSTANILLAKLSEIAEPSAISDEKVINILTTAIKESLETFRSRYSVDQINAIAPRLKAIYDQNSNESVRVQIGINLMLLREISVNDLSKDEEPLKQYIEQMLQSLPAPSLDDIFKALQILNKEGALYDTYRSGLESRAMSQSDMFNWLATNYDDSHVEPFVGRFIKDSGLWSQGVEEVRKWRSVKNKELVANCVLSRAQRENFPDNIALFSLLPHVGFKDEKFKETFITYLFTLLQNQNVDFQKQTSIAVNQLKASGYLTKSDLEKLTTLTVEHLERQNLSTPGYFEGTFELVSLLPMSANIHKKFAQMLIGKIAVNSIEDRGAMGKILYWAKEAAIHYSQNVEEYEALYNALRTRNPETQKFVAGQIIELGLVDGRSKDFYQRIEHLTGNA